MTSGYSNSTFYCSLNALYITGISVGKKYIQHVIDNNCKTKSLRKPVFPLYSLVFALPNYKLKKFPKSLFLFRQVISLTPLYTELWCA